MIEIKPDEPEKESPSGAKDMFYTFATILLWLEFIIFLIKFCG